MTSSTKQALFILAGGVVAFLVIGVAGLFGTALYRGTATVPDIVVTQVWTVLTGLLVVSSTAVMAYISSKNAQRSRENANINAAETQAALGQKVEAVGAALHDGIKNDFAAAAADLVNIDAAKRADELARTTKTAEDALRLSQQVATNVETLAAMKAQIEQIASLVSARSTVSLLPAVMAGQPQPAIVTPNGDPVHTELAEPVATAIEQAAETLRVEVAKNSERTAENTEVTAALTDAQKATDAETPKEKP